MVDVYFFPNPLDDVAIIEDHEDRQHTDPPDTSPFFDAVYQRAGVKRKREIGHPSYEPESQLATDEDYPATEINADYDEAIEGV